QRQGLVEAGQGLCRVPQHPEGQRSKGSADNIRIEAHVEHWRKVLVWRVACNGFLQMLASSRKRPEVELRPPGGRVGNDRECRGVGMLRQAQQLSPEFLRCTQLWPYNKKPPQPKQDRHKLRRFAHPLTQRACL